LDRLFLRNAFRTAYHDLNEGAAAEKPRDATPDKSLPEMKENGCLTVCAESGLA